MVLEVPRRHAQHTADVVRHSGLLLPCGLAGMRGGMPEPGGGTTGVTLTGGGPSSERFVECAASVARSPAAARAVPGCEECCPLCHGDLCWCYFAS
jgi:hypothetical protein